MAGAKRFIAVTLSTVLAFALSGPAHASSGSTTIVSDRNITVEVIASNGSGCAPGTARVTGNADDTGFRVRYQNFTAEAGGNADPTSSRKNCQLSVLVTTPPGWTVAIAEAEYRGRAHLHSGASALHRTNYYWQGSSRDNRVNERFAGPFFGTWSTRDVEAVLHYAPCAEQRVLNLNTELRVDARGSSSRSSMSMSATEGNAETLFNISWARC
ncbi:DUF4360 domain-containing protein [Actinoplanes sp. NEAU-A12]|uniref:DUF4360 domain-containing protein n=1 Tax=Actinoplanes sandaracinus TaxID=3045177 RepID=A0ABT6WWK4_9ACTN|nr:DUF4360 domain-containing protein [Actinoplanes sandaracinus]MDI6104100.1 DUF4360 domain-containing protein [Actinoplanes sandaracinus]